MGLSEVLAALPPHEADEVIESVLAGSGATDEEAPEVMAAWLAGQAVTPPDDAELADWVAADSEVLDRVRAAVIAEQQAAWDRSAAISELHARWCRPDVNDLVEDNPDRGQGKRLRRVRRAATSPLRPHVARLTSRDPADEADRIDADVLAEAFVVAEVALANGVSERQAREWHRIGTALSSGQFPRVAAALRAGAIDWAKARTVVTAVSGRRPLIIQQVEELVVPEASLPDPVLRSVPALRARIRALLLILDPRTEEEAHQAEREDRRVYTRAISPVTGELVAVLPLEQIAAIGARLDSAATDARQARDPRTPDQVRADLLARLLIYGDVPGAPSPTAPPSTAPTTARPAGNRAAPDAASLKVTLVMTLEALLGLRDDPAYLDRYGPIPAAFARDLAAHGTFRCAALDDAHGTVVGLGRKADRDGYRPGTRLQDLIRATWPHCSFPGCTVRATRGNDRCEVDHAVPWPQGRTCSCNLSPLCKRHHQLKTLGRIALEPSTDPDDPPGTLHWRLPSGRQYASRPDSFLTRLRPVGRVFDDPWEPPPF